VMLEKGLVNANPLSFNCSIFILILRYRCAVYFSRVMRGQNSTLGTDLGGLKLDQGPFNRAYLPKYRAMGYKATDGQFSASTITPQSHYLL
jgi:hypothetical protein